MVKATLSLFIFLFTTGNAFALDFSAYETARAGRVDVIPHATDSVELTSSNPHIHNKIFYRSFQCTSRFETKELAILYSLDTGWEAGKTQYQGLCELKTVSNGNIFSCLRQDSDLLRHCHFQLIQQLNLRFTPIRTAEVQPTEYLGVE